jgi:hypothetical protein
MSAIVEAVPPLNNATAAPINGQSTLRRRDTFERYVIDFDAWVESRVFEVLTAHREM